MPPPLVSVVMINHNGIPWLGAAMESVLVSREVPIELVVVDDVSTDGSRRLILETAGRDPRVRPVFLEKNLGISGARNKGIEAAAGEFVSIIDSDDLFLSDTPARQVHAFRMLSSSAPDLVLLTSDAWIINERGQRRGRYITRDWWGKSAVGDVPLWTLPSTFFFPRSRAARFFEPYRSADGPIFIYRMQQRGRVGFVGEPLIEYRLRMSSVTSQRGADMLRELRASAESRRRGSPEAPVLPGELPDPDAREVAAWVHGRNARNAAANGRLLLAAGETVRAAAADPAKTLRKLARALQGAGR